MKSKTKKKIKNTTNTKKVSIYTQIYTYFISLFPNSKAETELDPDLVDID
jgi:hypothetical protein